MNIICPNKNTLNITKVIKKLYQWKNFNHGFFTKEFQYIYVKKRIFVEEFLTSEIIDYKIYCFNGNPKFILVKKILNDNEENIINNYYDCDWNLTELETSDSHHIRDPNFKIEKPKNLKLMLKYAELLSQEFVFVRVDLYNYNDKIYLSELTFTPNNGFKKWKRKTDNTKIANLIDISKVKPYLFNK